MPLQPERFSSFCPIDIEAAQQMSAESITEAYWPVSSATFEILYSKVLNEFFSFLRDADEASADLCVGDTSFFDHLISFLHFTLVMNQAQHAGITLNSTRLSQSILTPDWQAIGNYYFHHFSQVRRGVALAEILYRNLKYNAHGMRTLAHAVHSPSKTNWVFGATERNWLAEAIISENSDGYLIRDWSNLFSLPLNSLSPHESSKRSIDLHEKITHPLFLRIKKSLESFDLKIDFSPIEFAFTQRLVVLSQIYERILSSSKLPRSILALAENDPRRKIFLVGFRRAGAKTNGVVHGDPLLGVYHQPYSVAMTMGHLSHYFTPGRVSADLCNSAYGSHFSQQLSVTMTPLPHSSKTQNAICLETTGITNGGPHKKRILVIGFPMNLVRYYDDGRLFFFHKLQLEIKILRTLKSAGIEVIYRPHPDRPEFIQEILGPLTRSFSTDAFEAAVANADVLIFTHITTSTFGYAIKTNKQIILLDSSKKEDWDPTGRALLEKRCRFLRVSCDDFERPEIDTNSLLDAIDDSHSLTDSVSNRDFEQFYWEE